MTNGSPAIVHEARKRGDALAEIEVKFNEFMAFCSASVTASDHKRCSHSPCGSVSGQ
jgi:hypothetical protein